VNAATKRIEVSTSVLAALIQIARHEGLNRRIEAIDLSTSPPTTWGEQQVGVLTLPTDAEQQDGNAGFHTLVMMLWEHHAFNESLVPHCRVQAVVQLVTDGPLVTQLDIPLEAWHFLQPDMASQLAETIQPIEVTD